MDWTNELIIKFIHLYRSYDFLWDTKNESHRNRHKVNAAWNEILEQMQVPCTITELKRKKESLLAAYRNCKSKKLKSEQYGDRPVYHPSWFAYELLDNFLGAHYEATHQYFETLDRSEPEIVNQDETNSEDSWRDPLIMEDDSTQRPEKNNFSSAHSSNSRKRQTATHFQRPIEYKNTISIETPSRSCDKSRTEDEDECDLYGKLLIRKLRRLPAECRDLVMLKIDKLVYETSVNYQSTNFITVASPVATSTGRKRSLVRSSNDAKEMQSGFTSKRPKKLPKISQIHIETTSDGSANAKIEEDNDSDDGDENIVVFGNYKM